LRSFPARTVLSLIQDLRLTMIWRVFLLALTVTLGLTGPVRSDSSPLRILVMGDSLMASNRQLDGSVAQALGQALQIQVQDHSIPGARFFMAVPVFSTSDLRIGAQFRQGPWDYVVMNGGGNDLLFGCGCGACLRMMNRLISQDATSGVIPELVAQMRAQGAQVIYTGYMRTPGVISPVESCGPLGDEMDRRLTLLAAQDTGFHFVLLADLVTIDGDRTYHGIDMVHPSVKGSRAIAARIAARIAP
jgi:acyl-CoA thioesterase I